jgi:hypothetical protein
MKNETKLLQEAASALKANDKDRAREILARLILDNPYNEKAWMYNAFAVVTIKQKIECLQNVIEINPTNEKAKELISQLEAQTRPQPPIKLTKTMVQGQAKQLPTREKESKHAHVISHSTQEEPTDNSLSGADILAIIGVLCGSFGIWGGYSLPLGVIAVLCGIGALAGGSKRGIASLLLGIFDILIIIRYLDSFSG